MDLYAQSMRRTGDGPAAVFHGAKGVFEIDRAGVNWEAVRADYMTGGASMAALARKHGVTAYAVRKRARAEGWAAARAAGGATEGDGAGADGPEAAVGAGSGTAGARAGDGASEAAVGAGTDSTGACAGDEASEAAVGAGADSDSEKPGAEAGAGGEARVARRTRMALLQMLERAAAAIPCDATEVKTTGDGGEVKLLKLRDLTAAYKELAGDLPAEDADGGSRVVIDV